MKKGELWIFEQLPQNVYQRKNRFKTTKEARDWLKGQGEEGKLYRVFQVRSGELSVAIESKRSLQESEESEEA